MRWVVNPASPAIADYNMLTFSWAAAATRLYGINDATGGTVTSSAPLGSETSKFFDFVIPEHADMFGIEFNGAWVSGTGPASWTVHRIEMWTVGPNGTSSDVTFNILGTATIDSGVSPIGPPILMSDQMLVGVNRALRITNFGEPLFAVSAAAAAKRRTIVWISPFALDLPLNGCYDRVFVHLSFVPNAAITASYSLKMRPIGLTLTTRESSR